MKVQPLPRIGFATACRCRFVQLNLCNLLGFVTALGTVPVPTQKHNTIEPKRTVGFNLSEMRRRYSPATLCPPGENYCKLPAQHVRN